MEDDYAPDIEVEINLEDLGDVYGVEVTCSNGRLNYCCPPITPLFEEWRAHHSKCDYCARPRSIEIKKCNRVNARTHFLVVVCDERNAKCVRDIAADATSGVIAKVNFGTSTWDVNYQWGGLSAEIIQPTKRQWDSTCYHRMRNMLAEWPLQGNSVLIIGIIDNIYRADRREEE